MCNVDLEAPDNHTQKEILFNDVLILWRQNCTCKNFVQCYARGSRQQCKRKNPVQCFLNKYSWNNITQVKTLCNVAQKDPDNIVNEKS